MNTEPLEPAGDWCASFFIMEIRQKVIPAIRRMKDFEYALELPVEYVVLLDSSLLQICTTSCITCNSRIKKYWFTPI